MSGNPLRTILCKKRIEIKYAAIALVLLGGLFLITYNNVLGGLEARADAVMDKIAKYGAPGMFLIAIPANMTLIIQLPYNLPMFSLILYADSVWEVAWLGAATGLGAAIGEIVSYAVTQAIIERVEELEQSALFQWTKRSIERRPGLIPYLVWLASATPLPDMIIIVSVAIARYPWRKIVVPMLLGKVFQNTVLALLFYLTTGSAPGLTSSSINFDLAAFILIVFSVLIAYQIEKTRVVRHEAAQMAG